MNMLFKNCNLISPDVELDGASILVENNMIRKIFAKGDALPQADKVIDVNGEMTVPGFVDVHCHGKSGVDFSDATDEAMTTIGIDKLKEGVTTFLPTTLTLPEEQLAKSLRTLQIMSRTASKASNSPASIWKARSSIRNVSVRRTPIS